MKTKPITPYVGKWRIVEMDQWDEDYLDMEVKAYLDISSDGIGEFQFGLVSGNLSGSVVDDFDVEHFEFTWSGIDEMDETFGSGWLAVVGKNKLEGKLRFDGGDVSTIVLERKRSGGNKK